MTHVDRLFAYRVESRQECVGCRKLSVECTVECVWRVSTGLYEVDDATVTELFLRSCSVQSKFEYCTRCASDQAHRVQRRLLSLPNIMVVVIDRPRSMQVRAEEQLVLALFGLENLELLGVCYERGSRHSSCACRSVDGDFWYLKHGAEPLCTGRTVDAILPSRVTLAVYQRRGGAAAFDGADFMVPAHAGSGRGLATRGTGSMPVGAAVSGVRATHEPSRERASMTSGNYYWDADGRTFADMYFAHGGDARAALLFKNTWLLLRAPFVRSSQQNMSEDAQGVVVDRVLAFLCDWRRPSMPNRFVVRCFGIFAM